MTNATLQKPKIKLRDLIKNKAQERMREWHEYLNANPRIKLIAENCIKHDLNPDVLYKAIADNDEGLALIKSLREAARGYVLDDDLGLELELDRYKGVKFDKPVAEVVPLFKLFLGSIKGKLEEQDRLEQLEKEQQEAERQRKNDILQQSGIDSDTPGGNIALEFTRFLQDGLKGFEESRLNDLRNIATEFVREIASMEDDGWMTVRNERERKWEKLGQHIDRLSTWVGSNISQHGDMKKELNQMKQWVGSTQAYIGSNAGVWGSTVVKNRVLAEGRSHVAAFVMAAIAFMFLTKAHIMRVNKTAVDKVITKTVQRS